MKWNSEIGPASIVGFLGAISVLITIGIMWQQQVSKTDAVALAAAKAESAISEQARRSERRDAVINEHSVSLSRIESSLGYINPALQRIEGKLNAPPK